MVVSIMQFGQMKFMELNKYLALLWRNALPRDGKRMQPKLSPYVGSKKIHGLMNESSIIV